jgi:hypothetical protein
MYYLVENGKQLEQFKKYNYKEAFIEIIPYSNSTHPTKNNICAFYIRPLLANKGYILPISHSETQNLNINEVIELLKGYEIIQVRDKKEFIHYLPLKTLYDITLPTPPYIPELTNSHTYFYRLYPNDPTINTIIPISKHYEYCEKIYNDLKDREIIDNKFFDTKASLVFNHIESNGLKINKELFSDYFHKTDEDFVYTQYNFKTLTRRPSNVFDGVNYAALSKSNGSRQCFIPRNDMLIELDISAYHPTLLAKLVNYDFGEGDIHKAFAKMYNVEYKKAKELTFKQLYGGIFNEYKELPFFKLVQEYTDKLWEKFQKDGYIECPVSKWRIYKENISDPKPQKILNYHLQNLETSYNIHILGDVIKLLKGCKTKLILYTYDSILLDASKEDKEIIKNIVQLFEKYKLQVKICYGRTYNFG